MRYANFRDHGSLSINHGDYLQFLVIEYLYKKMGITSSDIYYLSGYDVSSYSGETLLLPINFVSSIFIKENKLAISKDIYPVFLALSFSSVKEDFYPDRFMECSENRTFFLKYSPVGCRDEYTYRIFCKYGIPAYLNGCLTATLPLRKINAGQNKVIFADAPQSLLPYIPSEMFDNCEFTTQQSCFKKDEIDNYPEIFSYIKEKYMFYRDNASLVITSRLHVAVPCTAMGIPTVFAKDYIDTRFSWLEALIPLYSRENYDKIDWAPNPVLYEEKKKIMTDIAVERISSGYNIHTMSEKISPFYLSRKPIDKYYNSHLITHRNTLNVRKFLDERFSDKTKSFSFVLWGINENTKFWYNYIRSECPNAELKACIDTYQEGEFYGVSILKPNDLETLKDTYIFVLAVSAAEFAIGKFKEYHIPEERYCIAADAFIYEDIARSTK